MYIASCCGIFLNGSFYCLLRFVHCLQTLDLLCHITNASNVETICEKLLSYLKSTTDVDVYFRTDLVDRITELAERYPSNNMCALKCIDSIHN